MVVVFFAIFLLLAVLNVDRESSNPGFRLSLANVTTQAPSATPNITFETQTPLPFSGPQTTGASGNDTSVILPVSKTAAPSKTTTVSFVDVVEAKSTTTEYWWLILVAVICVIGLCAVVSTARQWLERQGNSSTLFLLYAAVNKNLAVIGLSTALVKASENWVGETNERWAFILSWSYFTLFAISVILTVQLGLAVYGVSRQIHSLMDWEVHHASSVMPKSTVVKGGGRGNQQPLLLEDEDPLGARNNFRHLVLSDVRHVFRRQLALMYPAERHDVIHIRVSAYLGELQNTLMLSMVTFQWKNWLAVCGFAILNALRQTAIGRTSTEVSTSLLIQDSATFVFALGLLPLVIFLIFYFLLNRSVAEYLQAAKKQANSYYAAQEKNVARHSRLVAGILKSKGMMRTSTLSLDPSAPVDKADFISPIGFLVFKRTSMTLGVYRGCVLFNSVYLAFLMMGLSEAIMTRVSWGAIMLIFALLPSIVVLWLLPWSSLLLVTVCSMGPALDVEVVERLKRRTQYKSLYPAHVRMADPDDGENGEARVLSPTDVFGDENEPRKQSNPLLSLHDGGASSSNRDLLGKDEPIRHRLDLTSDLGTEGQTTDRSSLGTLLDDLSPIPNVRNEISTLEGSDDLQTMRTRNPLAGKGVSFSLGDDAASKDSRGSTASFDPAELRELLAKVDGSNGGPPKLSEEQLKLNMEEKLSLVEKIFKRAKDEEMSKFVDEKKVAVPAAATNCDPPDDEELVRRYELNLARVNRRIQHFQAENQKLHNEITVTTAHRNKDERQFHQMVQSLTNRPDLGPAWQEKLKHTETALAIKEKLKAKELMTRQEQARKIKVLRHLDRSLLTEAERHMLDVEAAAEEAKGVVVGPPGTKKFKPYGVGAGVDDTPQLVTLHRGMSAEEILQLLKPTRADNLVHLPKQEIRQIGRNEDPHARWLIDKMQAAPTVVDEKAEAKRLERQQARLKRLSKNVSIPEKHRHGENDADSATGSAVPSMFDDKSTALPSVPASTVSGGVEGEAQELLKLSPPMALDPESKKNNEGTLNHEEKDFLDMNFGKPDSLTEDVMDGYDVASDLSDSLESIFSTDNQLVRQDKIHRNGLKKERRVRAEEERQRALDFSTWGDDLPTLSYADVVQMRKDLEEEEIQKQLSAATAHAPSPGRKHTTAVDIDDDDL